MGDELIHYGVLGMKWGVRKDGMPQGYEGNGSAKARRRIAAVEGGLIGYGIERNRQKKNGELQPKNKESQPKKSKEPKIKNDTAKARRRRAAIEGGLIGYGIERNKQKKNGELQPKNKQTSPKEATNKVKKVMNDPKFKRGMAIAGGIAVGVTAAVVINHLAGKSKNSAMKYDAAKLGDFNMRNPKAANLDMSYLNNISVPDLSFKDVFTSDKFDIIAPDIITPEMLDADDFVLKL